MRTWAILLFAVAVVANGCGGGSGRAGGHDDPAARIFLVGGDETALGRTFRTDDLGRTWEAVVNPASDQLDGPIRPVFGFLTRDEGFGIGDAGDVVGTSDGGSSWPTLPSTPRFASDDVLNAVGFFDPEHGVAIRTTARSGPPPSNSYAFALFVTSDGGVSWSVAAGNERSNPARVCTTPAGLGVAFGPPIISHAAPFALLIMSRDRGRTWRELPFPENIVYVMDCTGVETIWLGGPSHLYRWNEASASWDDRTASLPPDARGLPLEQVDFTGERDGVILAGSYNNPEQRILVTHDGGSTWDSRPVPAPINELAPIDGTTLLAVTGGARDGVVSSRDAGRTWSPLALPPGVTNVDVIEVARDR